MANALEHLANQTKLEWTASLDTEFQPEKNYRRTSIIGTIGMWQLPVRF
jgi:pyruvate kinase